MKICKLCNVEKDESEFYKTRLECKVCTREKHKIYRLENKDKIKEKQYLLREENNFKKRNISKEKRALRNKNRQQRRRENKEEEKTKN